MKIEDTKTKGTGALLLETVSHPVLIEAVGDALQVGSVPSLEGYPVDRMMIWRSGRLVPAREGMDLLEEDTFVAILDLSGRQIREVSSGRTAVIGKKLKKSYPKSFQNRSKK